MKKISLVQPKKVEGKTSQDKMITNDQQQKLKELIEQRNKTIRELKEIAQEYLEKIEKDSDDNGGGGGLPSGFELVAQYTANPSDTTIKEIRELVAKATVIKQNETGNGFADLIGKSGIGIITEIAKNTDAKGSLSDALENLKKMQSSKSKDLNL